VQGRDGADHAGRASAYDPTSLERSSADTVARERREEARQRQERAAREEEEAKRAREEARRATPQTEASP
jgi:sRNA-binding protein